MFLCLSSGHSPRYRQDVLRALSLPVGAELQFRYDKKWVSPSVMEKIGTGAPARFRCTVLIVYIDQANKTTIPQLLPCRRATLEDVVDHGTTLSLLLRVSDFALATDTTLFNDEMRKSASDLPRYEGGTISGSYWLEMPAKPESVQFSNELGDWERIVTQLASHEEFSSEPLFYHVQGIFKFGENDVAIMHGSDIELRAATPYELRIYHYHPTKAPDIALRLVAVNPALVTLSQNPEVTVDSRYDMKRFRFSTARPFATERSALTLLKGKCQTFSWELDLPIKVSSSLPRNICLVLLLGIGLAAPQVTAVFQNPSLAAHNRTVIVLVALGASFITAAAATWGLKRPL